MKLVLDPEQQQLRSAVRALLTAHAPSAAVRAAMESEAGFDHELWRRMATELDVLGLVVPETLGGAGAGHVERSIVAEELGRALAPSPFLGSAVLATDLLLALDAGAELLPRMVSGELVAAVAIAEGAGPWAPDGGRTTAREAEGSWTLSGTKTAVVAGNVADVLLVHAATPDGPGWFRVDVPDAVGLHRTTLTTLDPTRRLARVHFDATPAVHLPTPDPVGVFERVRDLGSVALAAEQLGGLAKVLETTAQYAKVRVQFGRPIGSYQAVKHGLADVYCDLELGTSTVRYAAWAADFAPDELPVAATLAATYVGPAYFRAAQAGVQYHGGIGYTWEHDAHLYYKRAKSTELLFGSPAQDRARLADRLGV